MKHHRRGPDPGRTPGQVRIVGGRWRGSKLPVAAADGLRPSADRVRETLFNWLAPVVRDARCLDLFAGSGALGFEAGSRGAARVVMIERDPALVASLRESVRRLRADPIELHAGDAVALLGHDLGGPFDIAFVDPPFAAGLWPAVIGALPAQLADRSWIYLESPPDGVPVVPADWLLHREGRTREVRYALYRRDTQLRADEPERVPGMPPAAGLT
jgi:16S rRNA (guanine966-N2)-methyltransferase